MRKLGRQRCLGFTLLELLIVLVMIGTIYSIVTPQIKNVYQRYKSALLAEKLLLYLSEKRREAFLYGLSYEISSKDGALVVNQNETYQLKGTYLKVLRPFWILPMGTSTGGEIEFSAEGYTWKIIIQAPHGEITLKET